MSNVQPAARASMDEEPHGDIMTSVSEDPDLFWIAVAPKTVIMIIVIDINVIAA
jgi:hypothetical protein